MPVLAWIILALALFEGGWLAFDGAHALVSGDYVTPKSGRFEGQLGPWSKLVEGVGLNPRSTLVKWIHVIIGVAWLIAMVGFMSRAEWGWWAMLGCAIAALWYLPFGTVLSAVQVGLLLWLRKDYGQ